MLSYLSISRWCCSLKWTGGGGKTGPVGKDKERLQVCLWSSLQWIWLVPEGRWWHLCDNRESQGSPGGLWHELSHTFWASLQTPRGIFFGKSRLCIGKRSPQKNSELTNGINNASICHQEDNGDEDVNLGEKCQYKFNGQRQRKASSMFMMIISLNLTGFWRQMMTPSW